MLTLIDYLPDTPFGDCIRALQAHIDAQKFVRIEKGPITLLRVDKQWVYMGGSLCAVSEPILRNVQIVSPDCAVISLAAGTLFVVMEQFDFQELLTNTHAQIPT